MTELNKNDVLKHEFKVGIYQWETKRIKQRAYLYPGPTGLRVHGEIKGTDYWRPSSIYETTQLRSALLEPFTENITAEFSEKPRKRRAVK